MGGFCAAPASAGLTWRGRFSTQTRSFLSTTSPVEFQRIQLFGSSLGQDASTLYCGTAGARDCVMAAGTTTQTEITSANRLFHFPVHIECSWSIPVVKCQMSRV